MTPSTVDFIILGILVFTLIRGAAKGIVWQLAWIVALLLCFAISERCSVALSALVPAEEPLNRWIAMFAIYMLCVFISFWGAKKISRWMEKHRFADFDRHFGAIFGLFKGILFSLTLIFFAVALSPRAKEIIQQTKSGYASAWIMNRLHPLMSEEFHDTLDEYIHLLDDTVGKENLQHSHHHDEDEDKTGDKDHHLEKTKPSEQPFKIDPKIVPDIFKDINSPE